MIKLDPLEALDLIPHPLTIVTAGDPEKPGKRGGMTAAWVSRVSWNPPLIAVSMTRSRYTYQLIKEYKAFVVHVVSKRFEKMALEIFGSLSGRDRDKFELAGIQPIKAEKVVAPIIPGMPLSIECIFVAEHVAGDHVIVIGEVVKGHKGSEEPLLVWMNGSSYEIKM
ncbi:MAG: flavin reductase family protein [Ignisphaera sp.]